MRQKVCEAIGSVSVFLVWGGGHREVLRGGGAQGGTQGGGGGGGGTGRHSGEGGHKEALTPSLERDPHELCTQTQGYASSLFFMNTYFPWDD